VLCHCAGSVTFFMAMCTGKLEGKVNQIVASSIALNVVTNSTKTIEALFHLPNVLDKIAKFHTANPSVSGGLFNSITSTQSLAGASRHEHCSSKVCHRISFLYSLLWDHKNLNTETHDILHEIFGNASVKIFGQICACTRAGYLVDLNGADVYMPTAAANLKLPIYFLSGEDNQIWHPKGTELSLEYLSKQNGPEYYTRYVPKGYGHLDCIFGQAANVDIFPYLLEFLDKNQQHHH